MAIDLSHNVSDKSYTDAEVKRAQDVLAAIMRQKKSGMFAVIERIEDESGNTMIIQGQSGVYHMKMAELEMVLEKIKGGHTANAGKESIDKLIASMPSDMIGDLFKIFLKEKRQ